MIHLSVYEVGLCTMIPIKSQALPLSDDATAQQIDSKAIADPIPNNFLSRKVIFV